MSCQANVSPTFTPTDITDYNTTTDATTINVGKAALTVTANNQTKVYGAPNPTLTGTITGIQYSDNITATYGTTATQMSPVGTYPITATLNNPANRLLNYTVTQNSGTLISRYRLRPSTC